MPNKKNPQQQAENLASLNALTDELAEVRADNLVDTLDALTIQKFLQKVGESNGELGIKAQAILSQVRMGVYGKIAAENIEAEAATVPEEEIEAMKRKAFGAGRVVRSITSSSQDNDLDDGQELRALMGG